jgi:hypothetical protein
MSNTYLVRVFVCGQYNEWRWVREESVALVVKKRAGNGAHKIESWRHCTYAARSGDNAPPAVVSRADATMERLRDDAAWPTAARVG